MNALTHAATRLKKRYPSRLRTFSLALAATQGDTGGFRGEGADSEPQGRTGAGTHSPAPLILNVYKKRSAAGLFLLTLLYLCPAPFACRAAFAVVMDGRIGEVPGLRFENVRYEWDSIFIDIVNMTDRNVFFGGTMIFLDRHGDPVASARLLPHRIDRNSVKRYRGYFTRGAGEAARRASRVIWDLGPRREE